MPRSWTWQRLWGKDACVGARHFEAPGPFRLIGFDVPKGTTRSQGLLDRDCISSLDGMAEGRLETRGGCCTLVCRRIAATRAQFTETLLPRSTMRPEQLTDRRTPGLGTHRNLNDTARWRIELYDRHRH